MKKLLTLIALTASALATSSAHALPTCNISNANETLCSNGKLYICKLNGVGSTDPDSGRWEKRGSCSDSFQDAETFVETDEQ